MNSDPTAAAQGANAFAAAVQWLQWMLLGTVATIVAVISVASIGLLLLSGRIDLRRGAQVVFGCFILFGASTIAAGIVHAVTDSAAAFSQPEIETPAAPVYSQSAANPPIQAVPYDPYAGAALPSRP